ncbi:hypothetical protein ABIC20_001511 [Methylobacterium radiotolerans]|uniref:Uncharacterized protein n=1 Tax=Methylobacterium radiotolerans TaxID=31998 RepID=A0ABV2NCJ1_9HYPH
MAGIVVAYDTDEREGVLVDPAEEMRLRRMAQGVDDVGTRLPVDLALRPAARLRAEGADARDDRAGDRGIVVEGQPHRVAQILHVHDAGERLATANRAEVAAVVPGPGLDLCARLDDADLVSAVPDRLRFKEFLDDLSGSACPGTSRSDDRDEELVRAKAPKQALARLARARAGRGWQTSGCRCIGHWGSTLGMPWSRSH